MNLLSKNAPLEESIRTMRTALEKAGCEMTFSAEKHPLPHCYSINVASVEAPNHIYANGKGIVSEASLASALGEYIERLQTNNFFVDFYLPGRRYYPDEKTFGFDEAYLSPELEAIYDPTGDLAPEDLVDFNSDYDDRIVALPFLRRSTAERCYIPLNILSNLYVSNGLSSGNTASEAQVQALSEICERYVKLEIIRNGYSLPAFPEEVVRGFERVASDREELRRCGYVVEILDASLGGRFPVTAISLINPKNSTLFVSFGAHPILQVSLERTMTELMQGRTLDELDAFETPTFDMSLVSDSFNLESHFIDSNGKLGFGFLSAEKTFEYASWGYAGEGSADEQGYLVSLIESMGKEIYVREYDYLGFYSCQIVVPGMSEVYPIEDLVYNNKNGGKGIREMILNLDQYDPEEVLETIEPLEESHNVEKYIGVLFEKNFTIRDLKAQMHLILENWDEALELLEFSSDPMGRIVAELIRMEQGGHEWSAYEAAFNHLFSEEKVRQAVAIKNGEAWLTEPKLHRDYERILEMYDRIERHKEAAYGS